MKTLLLPIAAALAAVATGAAAQPAQPWTGFYAGVNLGGLDAKSDIVIPNYPSAYNSSKTGLLGGGQVGFNYQVHPNWVIGVEGDLDAADVNDVSLIPNAPVADEKFSLKYNMTYSVRGRVGYAAGPWLIYGTGGWAGAHLDDAVYIPLAGGHNSASLSGWTAGAGVEYAASQHWVLGAEWLHSDYGKKNFVFNGPTSVKMQSEAFRARLSYLFN